MKVSFLVKEFGAISVDSTKLQCD